MTPFRRWTPAAFASVVLAAMWGCDDLGPDRARAVMTVFDAPPPRFTLLEGRRLESVIQFIGPCCDPDPRIEHQVDGLTVTIVPYVDHRPCLERCVSLVTDSTVFSFDRGGAVRVRVMREGEGGSLVAALDTTFALR